MPLVSIIMPSLNVVSYIEECLQSAINQTLKDIEIICIDAGSTDGTREVITKYLLTDKRIRLIDSTVKSYGYQVNLGIHEARGEYIGILETDDYVDCEMYMKWLKRITQTMYEQIMMNYLRLKVKGYLIPVTFLMILGIIILKQ